MSTKLLAERYARRPNRLASTTQTARVSYLKDAFACFIPMLMFIEFALIGRLFLTELLLLLMLPFLLLDRGQLIFAPLPTRLLVLCLAWLMAQMLTDVIRGTPFEDWARGWAKIVFLLSNFCAIYLYLNERKQRFIMFAVGIGLGQILGYFFNPGVFADDYPWKFGYGAGITLLAICASQMNIFKQKNVAVPAIMMGVGALNIYLNFRSLGLICLLAGLYVSVPRLKRPGIKGVNWVTVMILTCLGGSAVVGISAVYEYGATQNWFGDEAQEKYLMQAAGDEGVLLGGRTEIFASSQAIFDSPIIGHGSYAKDSKYVDIMAESLRQKGYEVEGEIESDRIPSHSYIMGAWVEAGLLGAFFWLWVLTVTARVLISTYRSNLALAPLIAFFGFNLMWSIPFSPLGAEARLYAAYSLSLMIYASSAPRSKKIKTRQV